VGLDQSLLVLILASAFQAAAAMSPQQLASTFSYDAKAPLDVRESRVESRSGIKVRDLTFSSPIGGRVPAYLVVPPGREVLAGIVYMHWGQGNRSEFLAEALMAARAGAASIMIDAPYRRPEHKTFPCGEAAREEYIQLITDLRRAVDVLLQGAAVDRKRLAYVGHSLGATWGGTLATVERRFGSHVLMGGLPSLAEAIREHTRKDPSAREEVPKLEDCLEALQPIESLHHVGKAAPAAILFQFARVDRFISEQAARKYFQAASEPKSIKWYEGGHEFTDPAALMDRLEWLEKRLALKPVRPIVEEWMGSRR
jgi:dienelactone hydrolase